jgi:serine/threonine protein kinase/Tfp pilus assembly protein PilF
MKNPFEQVESIFWNASQLATTAQRDSYLADACDGNQPLRDEVDQMLAAISVAGKFAEAFSPTLTDPSDALIGTVIGPYAIREKIGEGGMGVVYAAQQKEPLHRLVALKIIKPGMDSQQIIARFQSERETLALMDHPHIARVLDAGTTERGLPFFVMELVHGVPITQFADQQRLTFEERLRLFQDVCHAVQHAHRKGIIHRDIKPSNVLVTLHDGKPVVKVIDFGVAKAVGNQLTEHSIYTALGQMVGTPMYMSPEQAERSGLDVDTRSDVYSLGVLLYQLLTSSTPFDQDSFRAVGMEAMLRIIRDEDPLKPSQRLSTVNDESRSNVADSRQIDAKRLSKSLRGELDWIVMKAMEKDRNRRYDSPADLAEDLEYYLTKQPVEAGPPSAIYRLKKYISRHRLGLTASALVLSAIVAGAGFSVWYAVEADAARIEARRAEELATERLEQLAAEKQRLQEEQNNLRVEKTNSDRRYALAKRAVSSLIDEVARQKLASYPELAGFRVTLLETAEKFYGELLEESPADTSLLILRAEVRLKLNRNAEAFDDYLTAEHLQPGNLLVLLRLSDYFRLRAGDNSANGQIALDKALKATQLHPENSGAWILLGWAYAGRGDRQAASDAMRRAASVNTKEADKAHCIAVALSFEGRHLEAADEHLRAADLGSLDPAHDLYRRGFCLHEAGQFDEALESFTRSIELDSYRVDSFWGRGLVHSAQGDLELAANDWQHALLVDPGARHVLSSLCKCYLRMKNADALRQLIESRTGELAADTALIKLLKDKWIEESGNPALVRARDEFLERVKTRRLSDVNYQATNIRNEANRLVEARQPYDGLSLLRATNREDVAYAPNYYLLGMTLRYWTDEAERTEATEREAIAAFSKAFELDPNYWDPHDQLSRALSGSMFENLRDGEMAALHAERSRKIAKATGRSQGSYGPATLGMAYYRAGKYDQAIISLREARELGGIYYAPVEFFLAMCYWQLGDREEARRWYDLGMVDYRTAQLDTLYEITVAEAKELLSEIIPAKDESPANPSQGDPEQ